MSRPPAEPAPQSAIVATIIRGECRGASVVIDRSEIIDLIRRLRSRQELADTEVDPGSFTVGRHPLGNNHLFIGNADSAISNHHLHITPIEEDAIRIVHRGRSGSVTLVSGQTHDALAPGDSRNVVLPVELVLGDPSSTISIRHEDPCPAIDDGPAAWDEISAARRQTDNRTIVACAQADLSAWCAHLRKLFAADRVLVANRHELLAQAGTTPAVDDGFHLWQWYAFNGRAYRLLRNLSDISLADGHSSELGHGIVLRLFQGGTYLFVLRSAEAYSASDRERLTRIAWYVLGQNGGHADWLPRMHLEDHEPGHLRRLVDHLVAADPGLIARGKVEAIQRIAPRITRDTGIIFPRRTKKLLSANAGLDIPRRHAAVAQASQGRYYHRLRAWK